MKLINSKVELIEQQSGLEGVYKQIELAGRTCYKSEDKITPDSAKEFVDRMIKSGHGAMLEHGTVYLTIPLTLKKAYKYITHPHSKVNPLTLDNINGNAYITTNYRVLVENNWLDDLKYICEPTKYHERRMTARFTCDRGVSHEFVRHRVFSFAQESTRYCNYSKDKFNNELTFIVPSWLTKDMKSNITYLKLIDTLNNIEETYTTLTKNGYKAQEARCILPNALKTELVMTGFESDWKHFFDLRCAPSAHPDARKLALELKELIYGKQEK